MNDKNNSEPIENIIENDLHSNEKIKIKRGIKDKDLAIKVLGLVLENLGRVKVLETNAKEIECAHIEISD